jgi:hypothetical protein
MGLSIIRNTYTLWAILQSLKHNLKDSKILHNLSIILESMINIKAR